MRKDLPTGTVTFLFTDIEGSTRLLHSLGPDSYAEALTEHRRVLREAFAEHRGVEVDTQGDAFFVAFPTAEGAAAAALSAQEALAAGPISVRMGLHTGTPTVTGEGYVGVDVHRGARVAALAHGGQVVLSPASVALLEGHQFRDLGVHRLKDFEGAVRLSQLGDREFPPLRTPGSVDLPSPATRFIGRERELFDAVSLVYERDPRVLTIVGPGGTGKTRFAIELARLLADEADGGTVFLPLAPIRDSALVVQALGDRLGASNSDPVAIAAALRDRRTHVVVDNLEHLLPAAARSLADVVEAAPTLRIVATSREPLRIHGEVELDLPPLLDDDAVTLFVERAQAVRPDVERTTTVGELCRRLDRLPLALELAAARTKLLAPEALLDRLGDRLDLLKGTRDADERHATLRATIAWSYDLLDPREQELFARLAVFRAGCTLETAEAVCEADLETLGSLLDKSLVRRRTGRLGEERYWMLETIREFAAERLVQSGEVEDIRRRHARRMLEIADSAHLSEDDDEPFDLGRALAERDDLRAALEWASGSDVGIGLALAVSLEGFWNAHAQQEGAARLTALIEEARTAPPQIRATALRALGGTLDLSGEHELGRQRYEESLVLSREIGDERGVASATHRLAMSAVTHGDPAAARILAEESLRLSNGRFAFVDIPNYSVLGQVSFAEGRHDEGIALLQKSADLAGDIGWAWWRSGTLDIVARMETDLDRLDAAERDGIEALAIMQAQENRHWALYTLTTLARVALARQSLERAGVLWGAIEAEAKRMHDPGWEAARSRYEGDLPLETQAEFEAGRERGRALELWDAAAIALGEDVAQTVP